jgi:hypothetical protein
VRGVGFAEWRALHNGRRVHKDVERPESSNDIVDELTDLLWLGEIGAERRA